MMSVGMKMSKVEGLSQGHTGGIMVTMRVSVREDEQEVSE